MDKQEYKLKAEEIKALISKKEFKKAIKIAEQIDWNRVRSVAMLCTISDLYKVNRRYKESKELLLMAYERHPNGRMILYSLCELCIKLGEVVQAIEYYKEFVLLAPMDNGKYVLQYKIYEAQDVSLEERIAVLEELKKREYREKWGYELAYLYHRIGLITKCVEECDQLVLWFSEGRYVKKAIELKMLHEPLNLQQQETYERLSGGRKKSSDPKPKSEQIQPKMQVQETLPPVEARREESEELEIKVQPVKVGQYDTINLQKALAESMKEVLDPDKEGEVSVQTEEKKTVSGDTTALIYQREGSVQEVFFEDNTSEISKELGPEQLQLLREAAAYGAGGEISAKVQGMDLAGEEAARKPIEVQGEETGRESMEVSPQGAEQKPVEVSPEGIEQEPVEASPERTEQKPVGASPEGIEQEPVETSPERIEQELVEASPERIEQEPPEALLQGILQELVEVLPQEVAQEMIPKLTKAQLQEAVQVPLPLKEEPRKTKASPYETVAEEDPEATKELPSIREIMSRPLTQMPDTNVTVKPEFAREEPRPQEYPKKISSAEASEEEKQITGQMNIQDVLVEWEKAKKEIEEKRKEELTQKVLEQTGRMFTSFEEKIRDGILEQLEKEGKKSTVEAGTREAITADLVREEEARQTQEKKINQQESFQSLQSNLNEVQDEQFPRQIEKEKPPIKEFSREIRELTEEQKVLFGPFIQTRGGRRRFIRAIDSIRLTAYTGNVIVTGDNSSETLKFAKNILKDVQTMEPNFSGVIAKVSGSSLNSKNMDNAIAKLNNGGLIIEKASGMNSQAVSRLLKALNQEDTGIVVVLEDERKAIKRMLAAYPALETFFNARVEIEELNSDALTEYGRQYAYHMEYAIDELGMLALQTQIEDRQTSDHTVTVAEVRELIDEAIMSADKKSIRHFFDLILGKRYDEEDMIILRERDFN